MHTSDDANSLVSSVLHAAVHSTSVHSDVPVKLGQPPKVSAVDFFSAFETRTVTVADVHTDSDDEDIVCPLQDLSGHPVTVASDILHAALTTVSHDALAKAVTQISNLETTASWPLAKLGFGNRKLSASLSQARESVVALTNVPLAANGAHSRALAAAWRALHSGAQTPPTPSAISSAWQSVGFQGPNPATDLRAGGVAALVAMGWLGAIAPRCMARIVAASKAPGRPFDLAIVLLNVFVSTVRLLREGALNGHIETAAAVGDSALSRSPSAPGGLTPAISSSSRPSPIAGTGASAAHVASLSASLSMSGAVPPGAFTAAGAAVAAAASPSATAVVSPTDITALGVVSPTGPVTLGPSVSAPAGGVDVFGAAADAAPSPSTAAGGVVTGTAAQQAGVVMGVLAVAFGGLVYRFVDEWESAATRSMMDWDRVRSASVEGVGGAAAVKTLTQAAAKVGDGAVARVVGDSAKGRACRPSR